jgi:Cdc6-like AAA superfamily ATPase
VSGRTRPPDGGDGDAFEVALLALAAFVLGPFTLAAAAALAHVVRFHSRRWLWLPAAAGAGVCVLLRRLVERHLAAALTDVHSGIAGRPGRLLLAVWPHLWPAWLATTAAAPLLALALLARNNATARLNAPADEQQRRRAARFEHKIARTALTADDRPTTADQLFLGYKLGGDNLLPTRHRRVQLPLARLSHHLLIAGATGSGKTETALRIAYSLARASNWTIVYIDAKGDHQTKERFTALMRHAGRRVWLFPAQPYDGWRGSGEEIAGRLLQLIDFANEGGGAYYRDLAVNTIRLACDTPTGPPRSASELLARLQQGALRALHPKGSLALAEVAALGKEQLDGIRARYAAFFTTVAGALDGQNAFDQVDSAYFLLDGLRLKYEAGYLARFLVEDFTQWAVGRKPRSQQVLLIVDEFSAIAEAGQGLVDVVERSRGFGVATILCPQLAEGMGSPQAAARIIGSVQTILLHATPMPEQFVSVAGTRRVHFTTRQLEGDAYTGLGSTRVEHQFSVDPNEVRRLRVGQCFAIGSGLAMKLQIAPAPSAASLNAQPQALPVRA